MQRILTQFKRQTAPLRRWFRYPRLRPKQDHCDPADSVILASSGRSGSTWLAGLLNWDSEFRYLFEPMHHRWVEEFACLPRYSYLPAKANDEVSNSLRQAVCSAFSGELSNPWIDQFNPQPLPKRRLVKTIRGNLVLSGFGESCPDTPIIFLIRHPIAQALSVTKGGWQLDAQWLWQQDLFAKSYPDLCRYLKTISPDPFLKAVTFWCVENFVPINELNSETVLFTHYEDLVEHPKRELTRLFQFIGNTFDDRVLELVHVRSKTTRKSDNDNPLTRWRSAVTPLQQKQAHQIIAEFGLGRFYKEDGSRDQSFDDVKQHVQRSPFSESNSPTIAAGLTTP